MRWERWSMMLLGAALGAGTFAWTKPAPAPTEKTSLEDRPPLVTLYQRDELAAGFDFVTGAHAGRVVEGELVLDDAHVVYGLFERDRLTAGFARRSQAEVAELGDVVVDARRDLADRIAAPAISVFHTLRYNNATILYDTPNVQNVRHQAAQRLMNGLPSGGIRHLDPTPGQVHLLRIRPDVNRRDEILVKLLMVDHHPGVSTSFRWARLR